MNIRMVLVEPEGLVTAWRVGVEAMAASPQAEEVEEVEEALAVVVVATPGAVVAVAAPGLP